MENDWLFPALVSAAQTAYADYLQVCFDEKVLIVYDITCQDIADAFRQAAMEDGIKVKAQKIEPTGENGRDPDPKVCAMMLKYPVIIAPTQFSLTHSQSVRSAAAAGSRVATLPGITADLFERGLKVTPLELKGAGETWLRHLQGKHTIRVTTPHGTDITFTCGNTPFHNDDGCIHRSRIIGNLPAGEVFAAPDAGSANGCLVIDGSIGSMEWTPFSKHATIDLKNGSAVSFEGDRAKELEAKLRTCGDGGLVLAEFGIGTNPYLRMGGNLLEDEKIRGTVHFAFGNNCGFGGTNNVPIHIDGVISAPDMWIDDKQVMKKGDWLIK